MARNVLVNAGFLVALLSRKDSNHKCGRQRKRVPTLRHNAPDAVLSEAFHLLGARGAPALSALLQRRALIAAFNLDNDMEPVLKPCVMPS